MKSFNDYLKEAALSAKQKKIAKIAGDKDKIDAHDLAALRAGKKPVEEASCSDKDMKKEELVGKQHKLDKNKNGKLDAHDFKLLRKEETEQIDELSKKTLGSYVNKAAKDSRIHGQIATDFENTADKARKQSKKDSFERLNRKYLEKSWKREDGIKKAVDKLTKEEVQIDEGKMKELAMDLKDMSHDEFHKQYGKPKSHFDPTNFKKPVEPGKGMDRARALAQRGMQSLSKEEVERIEEKLSQLDELKDSTLQSYKDKAQNEIKNRKDSLKYYKAADSKFDGGLKDWKAKIDKRQRGVDTANKKLAKEEVSAEMSPYLKATLSVMDEGKIDDLRDAQKIRQSEKSAYDKDFKADTSHPSVTVHKGTSYGGSAQKDDETDEKPETKEKRSAGRPSGTSTGARLKGSKKEKDDIDGREYSLHLPK